VPREVIQVLLNDQIKDYTGRPTGVTADDIYDYLDLVNGRPGSYDPGDAAAPRAAGGRRRLGGTGACVQEARDRGAHRRARGAGREARRLRGGRLPGRRGQSAELSARR